LDLLPNASEREVEKKRKEGGGSFFGTNKFPPKFVSRTLLNRFLFILLRMFFKALHNGLDISGNMSQIRNDMASCNPVNVSHSCSRALEWKKELLSRVSWDVLIMQR
jgi:hypothetical protein